MPIKYLNALKAEVKDGCKEGLKTVLEKCRLVSREEFDIQAMVLSKTRLKLEMLEAQIKQLEEMIK